jgi:hypothetical protein
MKNFRVSLGISDYVKNDFKFTLILFKIQPYKGVNGSNKFNYE